MSVITVLKVFKNSSLITSQGEFKIDRVFPTGKAANKARYFYSKVWFNTPELAPAQRM
jgi:hypothetical protein